jgi:hypothetical protein
MSVLTSPAHDLKKRFWNALQDVASEFFLKKKYSIVVLFIFAGFYCGQMVALIGGRAMLEPIKISVHTKDGIELQDAKRFMQLARAGNYTLITPNTNVPDPLLVQGVFLKGMLVGMNKNHLTADTIVDIHLGRVLFSFTGEEVMAWKEFDSSESSPLRSDLQDSNRPTFVLYEVPDLVSLPKSHIPVYASFFGSVRNWAGDSILFVQPAYTALTHTILLVLLLLLVRILFKITSPGRPLLVDDTALRADRHRMHVAFVVGGTCILFLLSLVVVLVAKVYHPDVSLITKHIESTYLERFFKGFRPKPVERMQFVVAALSSPFLIGLVLYLLEKKKSLVGYLAKHYYAPIVGGAVLALFFWVYVGLALSGFYFISDSITYTGWASVLFVVGVIPLGVYMFSEGGAKKNFFKGGSALLTVFTFVLVFLFSVLIFSSHYSAYNLDPVIYPVAQVFAGKNMLVQVNSLYGLYPFYIVPIFNVIGLSVTSFSVVMATLTCLSVFFIYMFLRLVIKNESIRALGFFFVIFYSLFTTRTSPDYYYQYWPIRYIFPTLLLLVSAYYLKTRNKYVYGISFFVFGTSVLWNFDVGIIVFLTWLLVLWYDEITHGASVRKIATACGKHLLYGVLGLLSAIGFFVLLTYVQSGVLPQFSQFVVYQKMFLSGYYMIRLVSPPHIWTTLLLVYVIGLATSLFAMYTKRTTYRDTITFLLVSTGVGLFSYYEGQSSDVTLFRVWYPALLLIVLMADCLWETISTRRDAYFAEYLIFTLLFGMLLAAPINLLYRSPNYISSISYELIEPRTKSNVVTENVTYLRSKTKPNEKVLILDPILQGTYYAETNTRSVLDVPSLFDIVFPKEMDSLIHFLDSNTSTKLFVQQPLDAYDVFDLRIKKSITARYKVISSSKNGLSQYGIK